MTRFTSVDLDALHAELNAELHEQAQKGDTTACDFIHSHIADVEAVMQLVQDRAEAAS